MLLLYILLLAGLALFTAYTRNFQRTVIEIADALDQSAAAVAPRAQGWRTAAMLVAWPLAIGVGMTFVAWWKAVALVVAAFLMVPVLGALTPRPRSTHYLERIRTDLRARIARNAGDADELQRVLEAIDRLNREPSP